MAAPRIRTPSATHSSRRETLQLPHNSDFNGASQLGLGVYDVTQKNGIRFSSYNAFLEPVRQRKNLTIWTGADLRRLLVDRGRVTGVEMVRKGETLQVQCSGEVILSAGAIGTPMAVMQSGIGPAKTLQQADIEVFVEGIKLARRIFAAEPMADLKGREILPGPGVQSDADILAYLRAEALTVYHPVGTAKMGHDSLSVVEPASLKVRDMQNLRIADASIMPTLLGGNTNAPAIMIGEKCARMILEPQSA
ncbi:GMC family oxidoreductase [Pelagivirga sediminicola]|uniref:GMC family oxidoreductase n=1 Tax=Pelagivirga sediminicola TaxID=2170575 RepID=UPI001FAFFDBC|nr:GMC oxidoreductase [Pelagivirga sediminicola]